MRKLVNKIVCGDASEMPRANRASKGAPVIQQIAWHLETVAEFKSPRVENVDPLFHKRVAAEYDKAQSVPNDPLVKEAYLQLTREIDEQYQIFVDQGIKIIPSKNDPYKNSAEMIEDIRTNRRLNVYSSELSHPILADEQQIRFRAVHDLIGHASEGNQFGPIGEENAFRAQARTLSPRARHALATETRGQNSWVNFGPYSFKPVKERPYAEQKAFLLPEDLIQPYEIILEIAPNFENAWPTELNKFWPYIIW